MSQAFEPRDHFAIGRKMSAPPSVTVLVAAYNEAPVIGDVVREALRAVPSGEWEMANSGARRESPGWSVMRTSMYVVSSLVPDA